MPNICMTSLSFWGCFLMEIPFILLLFFSTPWIFVTRSVFLTSSLLPVWLPWYSKNFINSRNTHWLAVSIMFVIPHVLPLPFWQEERKRQETKRWRPCHDVNEERAIGVLNVFREIGVIWSTHYSWYNKALCWVYMSRIFVHCNISWNSYSMHVSPS